MKRLILLATAAIVVVFCFCKWALAPTGTPVSEERVQQTATSPPPVHPLQAPASRPATVAVARAVTTQPLTDARRRIFDSPNLMATIDRIHASGTDDEKQWALYLLFACVQLNARAALQQADAGNREQDPSASSAAAAALASLKKQASDALAARCAGVKAVAHLSDRQPLQDDLRAAAVANQSVLGRLGALASDRESRWSSEQAELITKALYGGDPVLAQAAFFALLGAMDPDSPGGLDRYIALETALGPIYAGAPMSDFERLAGCALIGRCDPAHDGYPVPPPSQDVTRLAAKYRAAVESRMDARSILAIR